MKTSVKKLIPLTLALMLVGCNEQVSSDLETAGNAGSTTGSTTGGGGPSNGISTFKITNTSPLILGYEMHRTGYTGGTSNRELPCEVNSAVNQSLSNAEYDAEAGLSHDDKTFDISCFLEAEELSLYHSGFSIKVEATANACNFVGYSPFSYFSWMPGDSSTSYTTTKCPEGATAMPSGANCGKYFASGFVTEIDPIEDEAELCRFDYSSQDGPNCDIGTVTINETELVLTDPDDLTSPLIPAAGGGLSVRTVNCGGKIAACVNGPIRDIPEAADKTRIEIITGTVTDTAFSKQYDFSPAVDDLLLSNRKYVNFRRDLSNPFFQYEDRAAGGVNNAVVLDAAYDTYADAFNDPLMSFDPNFIENYARNRKMTLNNNDVYASSTDIYEDENYSAVPYASEPFQSLKASARINPFYTFYCYDKAFENKARIRLVVREWDKVFADPSSDNGFDFMSDLWDGTIASMDNDGFDGYGEELNDLADWDDLIHMRRSPGAFNTLTTDFVPMVYFPLSTTNRYIETFWDVSANTYTSTNARFSNLIFPRDL